MDLTNIISIGGMSGLYKVVARIKNGVIAESLIDKKRVPAYDTQKVSRLEDIQIFSTADDVPLLEVLQKIYDKEKGGVCIDTKQPDAELKAYFKEAFPEYDEERVYVSAIKKVLGWYNQLHKEGLLDKKPDEKAEDKVDILSPEENAKTKSNLKETNQNIKTAGSKVKAAGVRKTGVA